MTEAFFFRDGDWLVGNDAARGPWSADACHAGPVTGAIAGSAESLVIDMQPVRLTANFMRPVPMTGIRIERQLLRSGRTTATVSVALFDRDNRQCAAAELLFIREEPNSLPTSSLPFPPFDTSRAGHFPVEETLHGKRFFGNSVEIRWPEGEDGSPGPTALWMRTPDIVDGEPTSPFQSVCPIADCGNGISRNTEMVNTSCVNADLTVSCFRLPTSDWLLSQSTSFWEPNGVGMSHSLLFDQRGAVGTALQSLVIRVKD